MFDCLLVETKITTIFTVVLYKKKQCCTKITPVILDFSIMSIVLSVSQLCKHVLKIAVDVFEKRKVKGGYKKCVSATTNKVWDTLKKLFPTSEKIVKEKVSKKTMQNCVRALLTGKETESVILYTFSENRETREGENLISLNINYLMLLYGSIKSK